MLVYLGFEGSNMSQKSWDRTMFYTVYYLLFYYCCWTFGRGMLSHSCHSSDSSCSTFPGFLCHTLMFCDVLNVFNWWKVQQPDSSTTKPCSCNISSMWFSIVLLIYTRMYHLTGSICYLYIIFSIDGAFSHIHVASSIGTNKPPYHLIGSLFECWSFSLV